MSISTGKTFDMDLEKLKAMHGFMQCFASKMAKRVLC